MGGLVIRESGSCPTGHRVLGTESGVTSAHSRNRLSHKLALRTKGAELPVRPLVLQVTPAPRTNREPTQVTAVHSDFISAGSLSFLNADLIQIYPKLMTTLITQTQSVMTPHDRFGGITNLGPRVSVCGSRRQHGGQGGRQHLAREDLQSQVGGRAGEVLGPAGQSLRWPMPREISVAWSSMLECGTQLSQQWSGTGLSSTLRAEYPTPLGLLTSVLAPLMPSGEFPQDPVYGWSRSADRLLWSHTQTS